MPAADVDDEIIGWAQSVQLLQPRYIVAVQPKVASGEAAQLIASQGNRARCEVDAVRLPATP